MTTDQEIAGAKRASDEAKAAYLEADRRLTELLTQRATELHGVKVGDRVADNRGRHGVVTKLRLWDSRRPWVVARQFRADGTPGLRDKCLYEDWSVISPEQKD